MTYNMFNGEINTDQELKKNINHYQIINIILSSTYYLNYITIHLCYFYVNKTIDNIKNEIFLLLIF